MDRHRLGFLISACLFFGLLALAVHLQLKQMPRDRNAQARTQTLPASILLPVPEFTEVVGSFQRNQTITQVLLQQGIPVEVVHQIVECARPVYDLARVKAAQFYYLYFTREGKFSNLRYAVDDERYLTVYHDVAEDRMIPVMKSFRYETRVEHIWRKSNLHSLPRS